MVRSLLFLLVGALVLGCEPDGASCASAGETRCAGDVAEVCDADRRWQRFLDCAELGPGWSCGGTADGHTCVPSDDDAGSR